MRSHGGRDRPPWPGEDQPLTPHSALEALPCSVSVPSPSANGGATYLPAPAEGRGSMITCKVGGWEAAFKGAAPSLTGPGGPCRRAPGCSVGLPHPQRGSDEGVLVVDGPGMPRVSLWLLNLELQEPPRGPVLRVPCGAPFLLLLQQGGVAGGWGFGVEPRGLQGPPLRSCVPGWGRGGQAMGGARLNSHSRRWRPGRASQGCAGSADRRRLGCPPCPCHAAAARPPRS